MIYSSLIHVLFLSLFFSFFFHDTSTTDIYTLSLHDALPICRLLNVGGPEMAPHTPQRSSRPGGAVARRALGGVGGDRKSTRLNSSHVAISYAVFCLKKKKKTNTVDNNNTKL